MSKKPFNPEEVKVLKANFYVKAVTSKSITYTKEFKEEFFNEYQGGKGPSQILNEMGFEPKMLGKRRIDSIVYRVKKYAERVDGFEDVRKNNTGRPMTKDLTVEEQLERLKHQNALLKQENEFLKKLEQIERKVQRNIQRQSKNSN